MRLICPNCSAQYEVDATLIPDEGRDVQCSNCGHTWFELPPAAPEFATAPEPEEIAPDPIAAADVDTEDEVEFSTEPEPVTTGSALVDQDDEPETPDHDEAPRDGGRAGLGDDTPSAAARAIAAAGERAEDEAPVIDPFAAAAAAGAGFRKRRPVDDEALDILREEADREMTQRRAPPTAPLETQTDLPLEEVRRRATPSRALRARMARPDDDTGPPKKAGKLDPRVQSADEGYEAPRRDLLPDIDEINSSLKSRKGRTQPGPETAPRGGFRAGFLLMVLLSVLMIFAYAWAPAIAAAVPSLEGALLVYVDWANGVRDVIDGMMGGA